MSTHTAPNKVRRAYTFIDLHRGEFSVQMMCRLLRFRGLAMTLGQIILCLTAPKKMLGLFGSLRIFHCQPRD